MKIDLSSLSDLELANLIRNAADELNDRLSEIQNIKRVAGAARPAPTSTASSRLTATNRTYPSITVATSPRTPPMNSNDKLEQAVEAAAKAIYDRLPLTQGLTEKPKWVETGNSLKQDDARIYARAAILAADTILHPPIAIIDTTPVTERI